MTATTDPDRYAVFGHPVRHSWSPLIHAEFARQTGERIDYQAEEIPTNGFPAAVRRFFAAGGRGLNVTLPFKEEAFGMCESHGERALESGAANTLLLDPEGRLYGENTDGVGLVGDICERLGGRLEGARVLVLGAGGAVRGVLGEILRMRPALVVVANRTRARAQRLVDERSGHGAGLLACGLDEIPVATPFDWVVNGTSASLGGKVVTIPDAVVAAETGCYDMVYGAQPTRFMSWCRERGASRVYDGLGMLVGQAAESFFLWRGVRPDPEPVIELLRKRLV